MCDYEHVLVWDWLTEQDQYLVLLGLDCLWTCSVNGLTDCVKALVWA